jgi:hypothetical protein
MNDSIKLFALAASLASASACVSVPVSPGYETLPPQVAGLKLQVGKIEADPGMSSGPLITAALRPALATALHTAGFRLAADASAADASVDVEVEPHTFAFSPYSTVLTVHGPQEREIEQVRFKGGSYGGNYNTSSGVFRDIAEGIAANLVAELSRSAKLLDFARALGPAPVQAPPAKAGSAWWQQGTSQDAPTIPGRR